MIDATLSTIFLKMKILCSPKLSDCTATQWQMQSPHPGSLTLATLYHLSASEAPKAPCPPIGGQRHGVHLANLESKTETPGWELISHLENSSKCNVTWRLGSHWSHGPVYITAIGWVVRWKDVYVYLYSSRWTATWNRLLTFAAMNAEQIPYNKACICGALFLFLN